MPTIARFYGSKADANLDKDGIIKSPDIMISKYEFIGKATLTIAALNAEFVLDTAAVITDDQFNSTGLKNLYVRDDTGKVARVKIDDTTGSTKKVIAVLADIIREEDGVTPATLTTATVYDVAILTPAASSGEYGGVYGSFFGYGKVGFTPSENYAQLKYGVPKSLVWQDLIEKGGKLSGETNMTASGDTLEAIMSYVLYGLQTNQKSYGMASNPGVKPFYRMVLVGLDRDGRAIADVFHKLQLKASGNIEYFSDDYKKIAFEAELFSFPFYPIDEADLGMKLII